MSSKYEKWVGKDIGKIKILKYFSIKYKQFFEIHCGYCDKVKTINIKGLVEGTVKSCGCQQYVRNYPNNRSPLFQDLSGQKFGKLTALTPERIELKSGEKRFYWNCQCECGEQKLVCAKHLKNGKTISCGCIMYGKGSKSFSWRGFEEISGRRWTRIKNGAKERNFPFEITMQDAWNQAVKQNKKCALTGLDLNFEYNETGNASLDRIDSNKGYLKDNIQWIDKRLNLMKMDFQEKEFIELCELVVKYNLCKKKI